MALLAKIDGWQQAYIWVGALGIVLSLLLLMLLKEAPPNTTPKTQSDRPTKQNYLALLKNRQVLFTAFIGFALWAPMSVFSELWGIPFLMQAQGMDNIEAATHIRWIWIGVAIGGPTMGWLSNHIKQRKSPIIAALITAILTDAFLIYIAPQGNTMLIDVLLFVFGFSAATQCITFGLVRDLHSLKTVGAGVGFNNMAVILGGTVLQPYAGWILEHLWDNTWNHHIHSYSIHSYQVAFAILPTLSALGLLCVLFCLKETHCQASRGPHAKSTSV